MQNRISRRHLDGIIPSRRHRAKQQQVGEINFVIHDEEGWRHMTEFAPAESASQQGSCSSAAQHLAPNHT